MTSAIKSNWTQERRGIFSVECIALERVEFAKKMFLSDGLLKLLSEDGAAWWDDDEMWRNINAACALMIVGQVHNECPQNSGNGSNSVPAFQIITQGSYRPESTSPTDVQAVAENGTCAIPQRSDVIVKLTNASQEFDLKNIWMNWRQCGGIVIIAGREGSCYITTFLYKPTIRQSYN